MPIKKKRSIFKQVKNKILTTGQVILFLIWAVASHKLDNGFSPMIFNILPIPNFKLVFITFALIIIGMQLQKRKDE